MSLYDFFHKFFNGPFGGNFRPPEYEDEYDSHQPRDPSFYSSGEENETREFNSTFDFNKLMTDPLEMHRFFEQSFGEILKNFPAPEEFFGDHFPGASIFDTPGPPAIEGSKDPRTRDHYLKPGFNKSKSDKDNSQEDLGDRSRSITSWLDDGMVPPDHQGKVVPSHPRVFSSFTSVTRKTIRLPDGTTKTEEIIRNPDGSEHRTESHTSPDQQDPPEFDAPFIDPRFFQGPFNLPQLPDVKKSVPRQQCLKPGYEKPNDVKIDSDLDKQILQSGIASLPDFPKDPQVIEHGQNTGFKSITRKTITLPNGVVESEEIVRNPDGTEKITVTQKLPDGTTIPLPALESTPKIFNKDWDQRPSALKGVKDIIEMLFK